ncbi:MAG: RNA polymerase factor sigma-54 [Bacteroidaceae bacterium]|nr:RNA polymerase factor sigma-54 [Bacteroidaceae bacterium]
MAQNSNQIQVQSQKQSLRLSQMQILAVKLLELPTVELEDRVKSELLDNPALEEGKDETPEDVADELENAEDEGDTSYNALDDYRNDDDIPDYRLQEQNYSRNEKMEEIPFSDTTSFFETLKDQLGEHDLDEHQRQLAEYLIGSLDDDGLLRKPLDTIADELHIYVGVETSVQELEDVLHIIQEFDPAGIGARNLQECLLLQIKRKGDTPEGKHDVWLPLEEKIISSFYKEFSTKHWNKICQQLGVSEADCQQAIKEITRLNPRPGASMGEAIGKNLQQITPDFLVDTDDEGHVTFSLNNPNLPELRLNNDFRRQLKELSEGSPNQTREQKDVAEFLKQKIDAAQGFIDAVRQRQTTMSSVMKAIIELQLPYFQEGDESLLKPMILKDVAERTKLDISTVSRVCNSKYAQTRFGIFPLRHFFVESFMRQDGEEMSAREVKKLLKDIIDKEDKSNPLTDDELTKMMEKNGYPMARRTVAKYRSQLNIPIARMRRE